MSTFSFRGLALLAVGGALFAPSVAAAADAPVRTIGLSPTGERTATLSPRAVSPDGREVVQFDAPNFRVLVRDVAAGTTSVLVDEAGPELSASNDTKRVVVTTSRRLVAADADDAYDLYLIDRAAGNAATLVTGPAVGIESSGGQQRIGLSDVLISGDGNVVRYTVAREVVDQGPLVTQARWRFDRRTGQSTSLPSTGGPVVRRLDDAGQVEISDTQIKVDGRTWPSPFPAPAESEAWIAQDGSAVVFKQRGQSRLVVVNTLTGVQRAVSVPSWVNPWGLQVFAPFNAGADYVLVGTKVTRGGVLRFAVGRLQVSNGSLVQQGADIPIVADVTFIGAISPNVAFATTASHLVQLGSIALPGSEPQVGSSASALDYIRFSDATCGYSMWGGRLWTKPTIYLKPDAQGSDLRLPSKADVTVTMSSGAVANRLTLRPWTSKELSTGRLGGFTYAVKVTFGDGSSVTNSATVPAHPTPTC